MTDTVRDLVTEALHELKVLAPGESLQERVGDVVLRRYNRLLDAWNATRHAVYADQFVTNTLTPSLSPHTLGPTGATWTTTQRPVSIDGASLWIGGSPNVKIPITIRDAAWWNDEHVPGLSTSYPTDLYPDLTWPNASLYFWPVPASAYEVELWTRIVLAAVTLDTAFSLPPGYWRAHVLTLAEESARVLGVELDPALVLEASRARMVAFGNNRPSVPLVTRDAGMPHGGRAKTFNRLTRTGT